MGSVPAGHYITPMQGLAAKLQDSEVLKGAAAASGSRGRILPLLSYSFKFFGFFLPSDYLEVMLFSFQIIGSFLNISD